MYKYNRHNIIIIIPKIKLKNKKRYNNFSVPTCILYFIDTYELYNIDDYEILCIILYRIQEIILLVNLW